MGGKNGWSGRDRWVDRMDGWKRQMSERNGWGGRDGWVEGMDGVDWTDG